MVLWTGVKYHGAVGGGHIDELCENLKAVTELSYVLDRVSGCHIFCYAWMGGIQVM